MKITIESTDVITTFNGRPARMCGFCGGELVRRRRSGGHREECLGEFLARIFCSRACHQAARARSRMSEEQRIQAKRESRRLGKARYRERHPERVRSAMRTRKLQRCYNVSPEAYDALHTIQGGRCAVCGALPERRPLSVDHDHETKQVRGLLCDRCNLALGLLRDSPSLVATLGRYLRGEGFTRLLPPGEPMKITIEPTAVRTTFNGAEVRQWQGTTERGVECTLYVVGVRVAKSDDLTQFERELQETDMPLELRPLGEVFNLRMF